MDRPFIGLLCGSDDASQPEWSMGAGVALHGNTDAWRLIDSKRFRKRRLHIAPSYFSQKRRWQLQYCNAIFNLITEGDRNARTLAVARDLVAPWRDRVVNDPTRVGDTTRDRNAARLGRVRELIVPPVLRLRYAAETGPKRAIAEVGLRFPVIARRPGTHSGKILGLLASVEDVERLLGPDCPELLLTEFVDFRSADGLYRKMRFFVIGNRVVLRHLLVSTHWNVHGKDRFGIMLQRDDLRREEQDLARDAGGVLTRAERLLLELRRLIGLDYFGVDCSLAADGRFILFEANGTMNFYPFSPDPRYAYVQACEAPAIEAMSEMLYARSLPAVGDARGPAQSQVS